MHRQVLPKSKKLDRLSRDIVFILGYKEENREAFDGTWNRYLKEHFFTPTYIFLDSEGNPQFKNVSDRYMHRMVSETSLVSTLGKLLKKNGKGAPRRNWTKVHKSLKEARETFEAGEPDKVMKILDKVIKKNAVPVLTERAKRLRAEISDKKFLAAEKERLEKTKPEPEESVEYESDSVYRETMAEALKGNIVKARDDLAFFLDADEGRDKYKKMLELRKRLEKQCKGAFTTGRVRAKEITFVGTDSELVEIGAIMGIKLPVVDEITIQFWVLTNKGNVFAGYRTYRDVKKGNHHQIAAYIQYSELEKKGEWSADEQVEDMRFEVYVSNELVASRVDSGKPKPEWWNTEDVKPLTFFHESGWGWDSGTMKPGRDGLVYGRPEAGPGKKKSDK